MRRGPLWVLGVLSQLACACGKESRFLQLGCARCGTTMVDQTLESHRCVYSIGENLEGAFAAACTDMQAGKISAAAAQDRAWTSLEMIIPHYNEECIAG